MGTSLIGWTLFASVAPQAPDVEIGPNHAQQANAGQTIIYNHILTNTGTTTDTFLLEFLSAQRWPTELLGGAYPTGTLVLPLQVGSQMTASCQLSLTVPLGVASITETTIITATSQISPTVYDIATDTTIVGPSLVYLPLVMMWWPPLPGPLYLHPIYIYTLENGSHIVRWNTAELALAYHLEEADDVNFSSLNVYTLTGTSRVFSAKTSCGTYYYRVRGHNDWGYGPYSNVESFNVPVEFTYVPPCGSYNNLRGRVCNVKPADYKIAVYLHAGYGWYNKPYWANRLTPIGSDGTWECDVTTGGVDMLADRFAAFLIPNDGRDAPFAGGGSLPGELSQYEGAWITRTCTTRFITFSGYEWEVKSSGFPVGPGPNYFSGNEEDVWVDENDQLHMRIAQRDGHWYCTEVFTTEPLGYGIYTFTLASRVDELDKNVILGLFTWDDAAPEHNYCEIDIEFSRWGEEAGDNSQFVVQPWGHTGNRHRFNMNLRGDYSTHSFDWGLDNIQFSSFHGRESPPDPGDEVESWLYTGVDIPPEGEGNARINLWLLDGNPPSDGETVEIVIEAFEFVPQSGVFQSAANA